ncbi:MAG TPA: beta-ketoacyl synthase N-terminal-like domain-containing protein [Xanthobacteraceae bacterium]|jgi:acyl transferase domain-containing protein/surfactin synthase thioesterase subunit|nr:beta-ketoacyl synthase N-terminal-like domain-containing protein [Xanthobacteraceae bacterium]
MMGGNNSAGVAIVGIACRFPGAGDASAFWQNLCAGVESISALRDEELLSAGVPAELLRDPSYVKAAALLPDIDQFDAAFFEYSPEEARLMDPQQRLLLEVAWESFEDAGERVGDSARPIGVFTGLGGVVTSYLLDRLPFRADLPGGTGNLAHLGNDKDFSSTRISYKLNLTGPSINVQTACSTSLVAVHLACQAILAGECDMALAGAATVRVPQRVGYTSVKGGILSPDGHCRAFDADAQGTIFGSGVGAILLKDLAAARADGNHIYAVIKGSAINNDGAGKVSYTASSAAGQARAMIEALLIADVSPDELGYVECHGTGTVVGDPLEIDALTRAFRTKTDRRGFCAIGSVKSNIGHLEQTAGLAALIKTALALKHGKIPPSLNFRTPNPKIDFAASPFFVNTQCREWPAGGHPRRAAVNSLGLGGTNAFVVLEEPPPATAVAHAAGPGLFALSARTPAALRASVERHLAWLTREESQLPDICFTSTSGRAHFSARFAAVVDSKERLREALLARATDALPQFAGKRRLAFLFSGQASQYARMGAELYRHHPVFQEEVDRCAEIVGNRLGRPLRDVLLGDDADSLIDDTAYTQPALFAVQAGLVALWRSWGIVPNVVLGHSVGEFAAAYSAGVYTLEQVLDLLVPRACLMQGLPRDGAMAAIFANQETVAAAMQQFEQKRIAIAALNAPENTVISGARAAVTALVAHFESLGIGCRLLAVSHAFHSPLMRNAAAKFGRIAAAVQGQPPKIPWLSTVTATPMSGPPDAKYWRDHALHPVRFADGVRALDETGVFDFLEIGPGRTLLAFARQCVNENAKAWLGSLSRGSELNAMLTSLGELYRRGYAVDWDGFNRPCGRRVPLPTYPFEHRRFWIEADAPMRMMRSHSDGLTGARLRSAMPDTQFESTYSLQRFAYLADHRIYGMPVLPTTVGLTALREAARQHFASDAVEIANLQYREAMVLPESGERIVQTILTPLDDSTAEFRVTSIGTNGGDTWRTHMLGVARKEASERNAQPGRLQLDQLRQRCISSIEVDGYYENLRASGLEYGASFRAIETLQRGNGEVLTRVRLPAHLSSEGQAGLHPALLDACLHLYPALIDAQGDFTRAAQESRCLYLPVGIERFRCADVRAREVWVHGVHRQRAYGDGEIVTVDITIYDDGGRFAAAIEGLSLKPLPAEALRPVVTAGKGNSRGQTSHAGAAATTAPGMDAAAIRRQLHEAPRERRRELLVGVVRQQAMKTLGITDVIEPARPLRELGLDSLMSVTLANRLEALIGVKISTVTLIQGPSIEEIAEDILPQVMPGEDVAVARPVQPEPSARVWTAGVTSDDVSLPEEIVVQRAHGLRNGPLASAAIVREEDQPAAIVRHPKAHAGGWLVIVGARAAPRARLFCFPFAGGGSAVYRTWARFIDPAIEVVAIEPPGRLGRITETPVADMKEFVEQLVPAMQDLLDRPFAFFGHCLGALTMYETARHLIRTTPARPSHLFVSGARPPDRIADQGGFERRVMHDLLKLAEFRISLPAYAQPDDVFAELIRHFNIRATEELLSHPKLRQLILPVVRAEFQMATNYRFVREPPWEIPITCFAAKGDPYVSREHALGWGRFTNSRLQVHIREGAHFAVVDDVAFIHDVINRELQGGADFVEHRPSVAPW